MAVVGADSSHGAWQYSTGTVRQALRFRAWDRSAGANGAISSLSTDGVQVYGSGYAFGAGASLEGTFAADPDTGAIAAARANDVVLLDAAQADALVGRLRDRPYAVTSTESDPFAERPRAPFTTSTLQQESGRKLRFTAARTMAVAQRLYERGYITYMRTDSTNLS